MDFSGKVVVVTGASSGIGAAVAVKFASLGADVALVARNRDNLQQTAAACEKHSPRKPLQIIADVSNDQDARNIIHQTIDHFGRLDVLINNAGVTTINSLENDIEDFDRVMATNLRAPFNLTCLAMPHLVKVRGNVVNVSSILSQQPNTGMASYCMSKAGLDMMAKCFALKYSANGVRINNVNPGPIKTEIFKRAGISDDSVPITAMEQVVPLQRWGRGEEIADLVAFIASERGSFITGSNHTIDGGVSLGTDIPW